MTSDVGRLAASFPDIAWGEPKRVTVVGRGVWYCCPVCIAAVGLRWEGTEDGIRPVRVTDGQPFPADASPTVVQDHIDKEHR